MGSDDTESYSADGLNQYTSVGGDSQSHDDRGDLTDDGSTTYGGACLRVWTRETAPGDRAAAPSRHSGGAGR